MKADSKEGTYSLCHDVEKVRAKVLAGGKLNCPVSSFTHEGTRKIYVRVNTWQSLILMHVSDVRSLQISIKTIWDMA